MITCPNCGELNGDDRNDCWKCHTHFDSTIKPRKKACPKCGNIYSQSKMICPDCGEHLVDYAKLAAAASEKASNDDHKAGWPLIVLSVLIPLFGIIYGYIKISGGKIEYGKSLILAGILSILIFSACGLSLRGCAAVLHHGSY